MDSILKLYWKENMNTEWTEDLLNEAFKAWSSGEDMNALRQLSTARYSLSVENPFHELLKSITLKLRTLCSSTPGGGKPKFLPPEELKRVITIIYNDNPSLTNSMREPTFGDFNETTQYWGGSGNGTKIVLEKETNNITEVLNPLFSDIVDELWMIREGVGLEWPLSPDVVNQLNAATLTVLRTQYAFSSITKLPEGYKEEVYKFANGTRGKGHINRRLTN